MSTDAIADRSTEALDQALDYARRGWSVLPVHTPRGDACSCGRADCPAVGKHPRVRWEREMHEAATTEEIALWWRRWPDANVAIVTGRVSGLVVLDVDPRHDGEASLRRLEDELGPLPETLESRSGGGGRHLWFAIPGESGPPSRVLAPGLDVKGEGGMAIAPPSLHASGERYAWLAGRGPGDRVPARLPDVVMARLLRSRHDGMTAPPPIPRTDREREDFERAWRRAGIVLADGDRYYRCPFHPDEHPSLHVDAESCRWYCFGCSRGGGIGILRQLLGESSPRVDRSRHRGRVDAGRVVTLPGTQRLEVVGEMAHQEALLTLAGGRSFGGVEVDAVAELVPEPANEVDPEAIAVAIGQQRVGYLSRIDARRMRHIVDAVRRNHGSATCRAVVRGGWDRGRGDVGPVGVILFVPSDRGVSVDQPPVPN